MKFSTFDYKVKQISEGNLTSAEMDKIEAFVLNLKTDNKKVARKSLKDKFKKLSDKDIDLFMELI